MHSQFSSIAAPPRPNQATLPNRLFIVVFLVLAHSAGSAGAATNAVSSLSDDGAGSLRQVIASSAAGDTVVFGLSGTISLSTGELPLIRDISILGPGQAQLTINANGSSRIFNISQGIQALIAGLTIQGGHARDGTNGVSDGTIASNGEPGQPGGAIVNSGNLRLWSCRLTANSSGNGGNGASVPNPPYGTPTAGAPGGAGGAIYSSGSLSLSNCVLEGNRTGKGGVSGTSTWSPGSGSGGDGGAIWSSGFLSMDSSVVTGNTTGEGAYLPIGGGGSWGGNGGGVWCAGSCSATRCVFGENRTGAGGHGGAGKPNGGSGGSGGYGGGIYCNGTLSLTNCSVTNNITANGGGGGGAYNSPGGPGGGGGQGGGVYSCTNLVLSGCTLSGNRTGGGGEGGGSSFAGGSGGTGGGGGGLFHSGNLLAVNCTFSGNLCGSGGGPGLGGLFPGGGGSGGSGGGAYIGGFTQLVVSCTIAGNAAGWGATAPAYPGQDGTGGGVAGYAAGFLNTLIAGNTGNTPDVSGDFVSLGHNLVGVTNGCTGFTAISDVTGSTNSPLDAKVAPLADNGGPTRTMALLAGSPCIDAGTTEGGPQTDQRGIARPQGTAPDIGAYEYRFDVPVITSARFQSASSFWLQSCGLPGQMYTLQVSTNLVLWDDLTNLLSSPCGVSEAIDTNLGDSRSRFYRLQTPEP